MSDHIHIPLKKHKGHSTWKGGTPNHKQLEAVENLADAAIFKFYNEQKPLLHLNLHKEYYDLILKKRKPEEYRELKPYWNRIFQGGKVKIKGRYYHPTDVNICFSNGYSKDRRQMIVSFRCLVVREGNPNWGAKLLRQYYVLVLGDILAVKPQ